MKYERYVNNSFGLLSNFDKIFIVHNIKKIFKDQQNNKGANDVNIKTNIKLKKRDQQCINCVVLHVEKAKSLTLQLIYPFFGI